MKIQLLSLLFVLLGFIRCLDTINSSTKQNFYRWKYGVMPLRLHIDSDEDDYKPMIKAFQVWNRATCVTFRYWRETDKVYVKIVNNEGCKVQYNMPVGGYQFITLSVNKTICKNDEMYLHLVGKILGLNKTFDQWMEQTKSVFLYRDLPFSNVRTVNIMHNCSGNCKRRPECPEEGFVDQFCNCHTLAEGKPKIKEFIHLDAKTQNITSYCKYWAEIGYCREHSAYMSNKCAKVCDYYNKKDEYQAVNCTNIQTDQNCTKWTKENECKTNPNYMLLNCAKSCQSCGKLVEYQQNYDCVNMYPDDKCKTFFDAGFCIERRQYMMYYCQKVCGFCNIKVYNMKRYCTDLFEELSCIGQAHYCNKKQKFMQRYCRKTCNFCNLPIIPYNTTCLNKKNDVLCDDYASMLYCQYEYKKRACRSSCNACRKAETVQCKNDISDRKCEELAAGKYCHSREDFMQMYCKKSCRICLN